jgi:hypothetical protein
MEGDMMEKNEYKDRLIEVLNHAKDIPIRDTVVEDGGDTVTAYLENGAKFIICVDNTYAKMLERGDI